jgi:hypothetical protein
MVSVPSAILETAEVRVVHQANVARLGAFDDDNVVFIEVLALVDEFHGRLQKGFFYTLDTVGGCNNGAQFISTDG